MSSTHRLTRGSVRRSLSLAAAGAMVFALTPVQSAFATHDEGARDINEAGDVCEGRNDGAFDDIADDRTDEAAECLNDLGIASGFADGTYRPTISITREQMASFLVRKMKSADQFQTEETYPPAPYTDREQIAEAHIANVDAATAEGVAEGFEDGSYRPGDPVTRGQMASFIVREMETITGQELTAQEDHFTDDDGTFHEENINIIADLGIAEGDANGDFNPRQSVTRGQMALFIARNVDALNNEFGITFTALVDGERPDEGQVGNQTVTERPELFSAAIVRTVTPSQATPTDEAGTTVSYTFDENVDLFAATAGEFHVYDVNGVQYDGIEIVSIEGNTVEVRFADIDTANEAAQLTLATVDFGAVRDDGGNANPEGDAPIGEETSTTVGSAGITDAPDLLSVGNFRQASSAGFTAVDFTFDEAAFVQNADGFSLILTNGTESDCVASSDPNTASGGTVPGGSGTTTITVSCPSVGGTQPSAANTARGTVDEDTVSDASLAGNTNALQAADVSSNGNTVEPDLVSADFRPSTTGGNDQVLFVFDEAVSTATATNFFVYDVEAEETAGTSAQINPNNATQVLVTFGVGTLDDAVGANVTDNAVRATDDNAGNEQDEVGVQNEQTTGQTPGETVAPQLTNVALSQGTDAFGDPTDFRATYTFDEDVALANAGDFYLYAANGTRYVATNCDDGQATGTEDDDEQIVCDAYVLAGTATAATSAQIGAAVLGTVDDGAVTEEGSGLANPEGGEPTTGGTGTPAE